MYILNYFLNFFNYDETMNQDYAAYVIQQAYRKHLIKKYFKYVKQHSQKSSSSGWFFY